MKKITNRLLCALILLCAFGVFVGCQQEPETKPGTSINSQVLWEHGYVMKIFQDLINLFFMIQGLQFFMYMERFGWMELILLQEILQKYTRLVMMKKGFCLNMLLMLISVIHLLHFQLVQIVLLMWKYNYFINNTKKATSNIWYFWSLFFCIHIKYYFQ